ncbi:hypothetical protein [Myxococcus sp. AM010]|uniref:hypothetical protein n=1 Tax=Myxococcus sp. AM010 TaxID=2745138 RepID=UPI001595EFCA|nr:hypothetical protein [Myxococcus sp. AM010]NVJ13149.1 hypothetical protein [Myxococcus sp. AM010]
MKPRDVKLSAALELEALLYRLLEVPAGGLEARHVESRLAELVRPHLVRVARQVARTWRVPVEDLVQEGLLAVLKRQRAHPFRPGAAGAGRSAYPAWAMQLGRQAMQAAALTWASPVHLTDHARKAVRRAKRTAAAEGVEVSSVLRRQGLDAETARALGEGAVAKPLSLEEVLSSRDASAECRDASSDRGHRGLAARTEVLLSLVDSTAERLALVAQRERVLWALYRLPRLERQVVQASMGLGRPEGHEATERTLAVELRLTQAQVRSLREAGLARLRAELGVEGSVLEAASPARGELRRPRAAAARQGRQAPRQGPGQMPLLALAGRA